MIKTDEHLTNYLLNNGEFPFKKRERFLFLLGDKTKEVLPLLKDLLNKLDIAIIKDVTILFFEDDGPINIKEIFKTISDDFGTNLHIHEAFTINKNIKGHLIIDYLEYVKRIKVLTKDYSSIVDVVLDSSELHLRNEFLQIHQLMLQS